MSIELKTFRHQLETVISEAMPGVVVPDSASSDFMRVGAMSRLLAVSIGDASEDCLRQIFDVVENGAANGDDDTKNAATTGFLENLQNRAASGSFPFERIAPMLGNVSMEYCLAWDEFSGSTTPGLRRT